MNRQQAKNLLPIIQAFAEGKTIQYRVSPSFPRPNNRDISYIKEWFDIDEYKCDGFSCDGTIDYRIKPESKYRPFKNKKECWQEMLKHQPFGWITDGPRICNVICIREDGILANTNINGTFYEFESSINLKFADGTPFGIIEN